MSNLIGQLLRGLTLALPLIAASAVAQEAGEGEGAESASGVIEELLVTARRREENAQDVPIPITAVSGEDLLDRAAHEVRDLARITPNLDFQQAASAKNTAQIFMRGIGQVNWAPPHDQKIGIYVDGVYLARPQGNVFDFLDVNRVEVLRGPQGTLFGRNTTAGLIHIISNRPQEEFDYSVGVGVGNDGILTGQAMLNIPLSDTFAARLAVQHRESDGYVKNTGTGEDWNDENAQMARLSLRWKPNEQFTGDLIVEMQRVRELSGLGSCEWGGPDNGLLAPFGLQSAAFWLGVYDEIKDTCNATKPYESGDNNPDPESTVDALGFSLNLDWDLGFASLASISSYRDLEDFNGSWGWGSDTVGTASYLEVLPIDDNEYEQWSQEVRLSGVAFDDSLDWVVGGYIFGEDATNAVHVPLFRGVPPPDCAVWPIACFPSPFGLPLGAVAVQFFQIGGSRSQVMTAENSSRALFGEVTWRFMEGWALTAGLRQTWDKREFTRSEELFIGIPDPTLVCPPGTPPPVNGTTCYIEEKFNKATPRVILSYNLSDDIMVYAGWSKGYSSGGFNQDVRMRFYEPEISGNWEAGIKSLLMDGRLLVNLTGFHNSYKNQQITVGRTVDGQPTADLLNAQKATLYGFEGEVRAELPAGFYMLGSFGILDGEYDEFTVQDNLTDLVTGEELILTRDLSDTEVVRGSPTTFSIALGQHRTFGDGGTLNAQLGWAFRGRIYNTLETLRSSRQGKYGLLDGRVVWTLPNGQTSIALWGTNLLDRVYYGSAIDLTGGAAPAGTNSKYWGEPRRFGIEFRHSLGG